MVRTPPQLSSAPTLEERFGRNLWRCRRRADLSQEELADRVGLSRTAIYTLELGHRLPRLDTILKLAAGTNNSAHLLFRRDAMATRLLRVHRRRVRDRTPGGALAQEPSKVTHTQRLKGGAC